VIRGETLHYDLVAKGVADGIMEVSLRSGKPVIFGVLATDTVDLAYKRSEEKGNNKGKDSAAIAIEMIDVLKRASASSQ
jgi:6,7-dimethyl-8-ribityllumazine synthase